MIMKRSHVACCIILLNVLKLHLLNIYYVHGCKGGRGGKTRSFGINTYKDFGYIFFFRNINIFSLSYISRRGDFLPFIFPFWKILGKLKCENIDPRLRYRRPVSVCRQFLPPLHSGRKLTKPNRAQSVFVILPTISESSKILKFSSKIPPLHNIKKQTEICMWNKERVLVGRYIA